MASYKIVEVIEVVKAPCEFSGRLYEYEHLSCGHYIIKREDRETAEIIRAAMLELSGKNRKRRCKQCVTGEPRAMQISKEWVKQHDTARPAP